MTLVERVKFIIKIVVSYVLYALGVLQVWKHIVLRKKAVVLMYHRVLTREERARTGSHPGIVVDRDAFASQMAMLKQRFNVLSVEEFADRMERKIPFDDASCLLTFDDGWRDNFSHALPILQRYGLPAVVFLPVKFIGGRRIFWQEHLTHLTLKAVKQARCEPGCRERLRKLLALADLDSMLDLPDHDPRLAIMEAVRRQKRLATSVIETTIASLASELDLRGDDHESLDGFLDWEQVKSMARQGIAFGGHGGEHRILTFVSLSEAQDEIRSAKDVIAGHLQETVPIFSYPNGNWSPDVAKLVEKAGYRLAFTTEPGFVSCEDNRFTVRRINIHEGLMNSRPLFLARIVGLF
ncbi:MAG: polysaccharide deacetylase family protein [Nitrospira sp.]|nr:polysaccharide deacetylase family protein [Nitrospira sp.]